MTTRDEALTEFAHRLASARHARDETYAAGGARAVAEAAHVPGGKSIEELAGEYERLVQRTRRPDAA